MGIQKQDVGVAVPLEDGPKDQRRRAGLARSLSSQPAPKGMVSKAEKPSPPQYDTPIIDMVHQIVQEKPGLKGHQIVKAVVSRDPTISFKVADRTGRTSLARLRKRNKIIQRNRKWYPAEDVDKEKEPAVGSLALSEPGWRN